MDITLSMVAKVLLSIFPIDLDLHHLSGLKDWWYFIVDDIVMVFLNQYQQIIILKLINVY